MIRHMIVIHHRNPNQAYKANYKTESTVYNTCRSVIDDHQKQNRRDERNIWQRLKVAWS